MNRLCNYFRCLQHGGVIAYIDMKTLIEKQEKIPHKSRTLRIKEPLLRRFDLYCRDRGGPSLVVNEIIERWLDESERIEAAQRNGK